PDWNSRIISFRLSYVANKIAALSAKSPPPEAIAGKPPAPISAPTEPGQAGATGDPESRVSELNSQLTMTREQIRQLQAEKVLLESKLKEALAMQPAESDPRELARAEEQLKLLQKENELLKVTVDKEKSKPVPAVDSRALDQAHREL